MNEMEEYNQNHRSSICYEREIANLKQRLEDYKEGCEGLKLSIQDLKQQRDDLRDNLQAIGDDATEQVEKGMVSFKQTSVLIKLKLIAKAKTAIAKCET